MELKFNGATADELNAQVKDYLSKVKGSRGGKNSGDDEGTTGAQAGGPVTGAPAPLMPPQGQAGGFPGGPGFAAPGPGAGQAGGFPAAGAGPSPAVAALVQRISTRLDWCLTPAPDGAGQALDPTLNWFRQQLGPETTNYTLDQIKQVALPRAAQPVLENIAKLMAA